MSVEYLLVVYNGDRDVLADGDRVGVTNHTILLASDEYIVTLSGDGYAPASADVPRRHLDHAAESCCLYLSSGCPCAR